MVGDPRFNRRPSHGGDPSRSCAIVVVSAAAPRDGRAQRRWPLDDHGVPPKASGGLRHPSTPWRHAEPESLSIQNGPKAEALGPASTRTLDIPCA